MIEQKGLYKQTALINRRDFLRFFGLGAAGLVLPLKSLDRVNKFPTITSASRVLGRVTEDRHPLHQNPDHQSDVIREMQKDSVLRSPGHALTRIPNHETGYGINWKAKVTLIQAGFSLSESSITRGYYYPGGGGIR